VYSGVSREAATVKFCVLASGSSGKRRLLATENTRILIDAGLSMRELARRLASIARTLHNLDAILITHEHSDHVAGLPVLARNKDLRAVIYLTRLTEPAIDWARAGRRAWRHSRPAPAFPSAISRCAVSACPTTPWTRSASRLEAEGVRIGMATDLGYVPDSIKFHCAARMCCCSRATTIWIC